MIALRRPYRAAAVKRGRKRRVTPTALLGCLREAGLNRAQPMPLRGRIGEAPSAVCSPPMRVHSGKNLRNSVFTRIRRSPWPVLLMLLGLASGRGAVPSSQVDFSRDVLPILSDNCYQCHGPDEKARKAKLRFDTKEGAFRVQDGKTVIVPGKSADSELVTRVTSTDPEEVMPPPKSNRKLTASQIGLLRRWVDEGAKWGVHWAFVPPARSRLPKTKLKGWARNGIDYFILARLEKEGLKPAAEARRETLIRRVTLDLTGLPPTPAEVDAFVRDRSANAYEKLVDRLLESPRFGERMAVEWLDLARYADTHGY